MPYVLASDSTAIPESKTTTPDSIKPVNGAFDVTVFLPVSSKVSLLYLLLLFKTMLLTRIYFMKRYSVTDLLSVYLIVASQFNLLLSCLSVR